MSTQMNLRDLQESTSALRSQLAAGVPLADAASRLVRLQPKHAQFWADAAAQMRLGRPLSTVVAGVWPEAAVSAVEAGEATGVLTAVLEQLTQSVKLQRALLKSAGRMKYPLAISVGSILVFVAFMLTIVPIIAQSIIRASGRVGEPDGLAGLGLQARTLLVDHWFVSAAGLIVLSIAFVGWVRSPTTRAEAIRLLLDAPLFGSALRHMSFGLWARYMAMAVAAGLSTRDSLGTTVAVLPEPLRAGVLALQHDLAVKHVPLDIASDPDKQSENDPRRAWPFYVGNAFAVGERTGNLDEELNRVAPELIALGQEEMERALEISNIAAMAFAAILIGSAMLVVYLPMLKSMANIR
ncbi:hypothetical protein LMG31884_46160 (plasmid) [Xanthomonas hydrangeae]|nr:hypothetical protein LMG31884_46160 [Xanthomonas hydrangeae]CAD7740036.1 hypothetical protein LMG31884_46160 [Xanthomonas hydrangeae]